MNLNSLSVLAAKPRTLRVGDASYTLHPLEIDDFAALQAWVDAQFRDPFDVIAEQVAKHPERWNATKQEYAMGLALKESVRGAPKIGTPAADVLLSSSPGISEIVYLSISKGDPNFTRDDARKIVAQINVGQESHIFSSTNVDMATHDPKGPRPTGKNSGNSASRRNRKASRPSSGTNSTTKP